jgi:uncharacterized protein with ACT and thioredoxin-like domain
MISTPFGPVLGWSHGLLTGKGHGRPRELRQMISQRISETLPRGGDLVVIEKLRAGVLGVMLVIWSSYQNEIELLHPAQTQKRRKYFKNIN